MTATDSIPVRTSKYMGPFQSPIGMPTVIAGVLLISVAASVRFPAEREQ